MLNKLLVEEFTKSRAYRTTANALVEGKNGAVVRKQIGHGAIGAEHAEELQKFYTAHLNPYLNFHRPCGYATIETNARGKRKPTYPHKNYRTPYEKLTSLKSWEKCLKPGITEVLLKRQAEALSDTEAARRMQKVKLALLDRCRKPQGHGLAATAGAPWKWRGDSSMTIGAHRLGNKRASERAHSGTRSNVSVRATRLEERGQKPAE